MENKYGYFNKDGSEFIITDPSTPRAFDNFLWNDAVFSNVQQTGVGYMDYQVGEGEAIQLLTGVGRICDFDVFGRDHLMSRLIYIRDNNTGEFWNINWEPVCREYDSYECRHGLGYTIIKTEVNGILSCFRIFVPSGNDPVELWTLEIVNQTDNPRSLSVFVYNQLQFKYKWGFDSYGDMIYRTSELNKELNAVIARKHPHKKPHNFLTGFLAADMPIASFDGSRDAFVGRYNTLQSPQAVINGSCSNTPGSADATIAAAEFKLNLLPNQSENISIILGATDSEAGVEELAKKYLGNFDLYFDELIESKKAFSKINTVSTPDNHLDRIINNWTKQATLFGATWCRWGWNGYRDIVQQGLGVSSFEPERTRNILLNAFKYQYKNGLAIRGWNPIDEKPYSDSALWLVFTLTSYLKETADFDFLNEEVDFYDGGSATVLEHIENALNFLESNKGAHGLILIKYGDWNDSLTAIGAKGRGETVWLSQAYAEAMLQMAELCEFLGQRDKSEDYFNRYNRIKEAINRNAWDGNWFTRCFDDNAEPVGSHKNEQAKIFIESQAWALISGISDQQKSEKIIESCDKYLATELGYKMLYPTFTKLEERIGRISSMEPGIAENGTVYSHTNIWMVLGLLKINKPDKAYQLFRKFTPGYYSGNQDDPKQKCPPYMYANCYFGPDHKNNKFQMEFAWITGSVAWIYNVIIGDMLGAKPGYNGLLIDPCIPSDWKEYSINRSYRGAVYNIVVKNPDGLTKGKPDIKINGKSIEGNILPVMPKDSVNEVEVVIK